MRIEAVTFFHEKHGVSYTPKSRSDTVYKVQYRGTIHSFSLFNSSNIDAFVLQAVYQIRIIFLYNVISIDFNSKRLCNIVHDTEP